MMDTDWSDDQIKLVRYEVVFINPELEVMLRERQEIVSCATTVEAFAGVKLAEFLSDLARGEVAVPGKWASRGYPPSECIRDGKFIALPNDDSKYLQVHSQLISKHVPENPEHGKDQVRALNEIADILDERD